MKLVDIIKTKNGLAFLGLNTNLIPVHYQHLTAEITFFHEEVNYGNFEFSFKDFARTLKKTYSKHLSNVFKTCEKTSYTLEKKEISSILLNGVLNFDGNFIDFEKTGEITFMPYNKEQRLDVNGGYMKTGRQKTSIHKFIPKVFKGMKYSEQTLKEFSDALLMEVCFNPIIETYSGEDIGRLYSELSTVGWARSSCMSNKKEYPPKRFTIYNENCELCLVKCGEEVVGRFLKWTDDNGKIYEDVFYYKTSKVYSWYTERCNTEQINCANNQREKLQFTLKRAVGTYGADECPPYFDTIKYKSAEDKFVSNKH